MMKKYVLAALFACSLTNVWAFTADQVAQAASSIEKRFVLYDGSYQKIPYPNGDVAENRGVCTDVVIRTYRKLGIDLQQKVHEDMRKNFALYPKNWGLKQADSNIDHRRVPNLQTFFKRFGTVKNISQNGADYVAGDIVTWMLPNNAPHIGIVLAERSADGKRPLIMHNIGWGQVKEDMLFDYKITGHYSYGF